MTSNNRNRKDLFDRWSKDYEVDVNDGEFPFIGYEEVLLSIIQQALIEPGHQILDLGVGTGNLAKLVALPVEQVWGADFSDKMLQKARSVLPQAHLIQVDLQSSDWPPAMQGPFDRIVSAYTFHEFSDLHKKALIQKLAQESLASDGLIVIGDISFKSQKSFENAHQEYQALWDEDETYWCADRAIPVLEADGFSVRYAQVSECGGVYRLARKVDENFLRMDIDH